MRISLLVESPLRTVLLRVRGLDADVRREIGTRTKSVAQTIWSDTLKEQALDRRQAALARSGRVGVTQQNVTLRAGGVGRLESGTPIAAIAKATEWGADPNKRIKTRSRTGTAYQRRLGPTFGAPRRGGHVAHPAARASIGRIASLWVQTAVRTIHETIERL